MLSMSQRHDIANELRELKIQLINYRGKNLKELPEPIQKSIRKQPALGTFTSSGLEHVTTILDRIDWAIFYLKDPDFPANIKSLRVPQSKPDHKDTNVISPPPPSVTSDTPSKPSTTLKMPTGIDFGPFDPRKK